MFLLREFRQVTRQLLTDRNSGKLARIYSQAFWNSTIYAALQKPTPPLMVQYSRLLHNQILNRNILLKTNEESSGNKLKSGRSLAIIFAWMKAKGKHLDKYCSIYLQKGYDVMTVNLSPRDMLFPVSGSQVVAQNILDYLMEHKEYDRILVHGFSVGAYLFGEFLVKLQQDKEKLAYLGPKFQGLVFDSAADIDGIPHGFPRAVAQNPYVVQALQLFINTHLKIMHGVATKHYIRASKSFHHMKLTCPTLLLVSNDDLVGSPDSNRKLQDNWVSHGIDVSFKCWESSGHCSHFLYYPDEYLSELETFFQKVQPKNTQQNVTSSCAE